MKIFRHPGLIVALVWVAAMVLAPIAAATVAGPGTDQLPGQPPAGQGMNQMQNTMQDTSSPAERGIPPGLAGNQTGHPGPQGRGFGNMTDDGNRTLYAPPAGNMTAPPADPSWDPSNTTTRQNFGNMTPPPMPPEGAGNSTVLNQTWHGPAGNQSVPIQPQETGSDQGSSQTSLVEEFLSWLRARTGG